MGRSPLGLKPYDARARVLGTLAATSLQLPPATVRGGRGVVETPQPRGGHGAARRRLATRPRGIGRFDFQNRSGDPKNFYFPKIPEKFV